MMIIGVDEVGRGCWAGPVVAGAVAFDEAIQIAGLRDSKLLSRKQRDSLEIIIKQKAQGWGIGWATSGEVDAHGLTAAVRLAMQRAVAAITVSYDKLIIDGAYNFLADTPRAETLIKADALVPAVSAASVIAKVARDNYMTDLARLLPGYGFENHVGYGTVAHQQALARLGPTEHHRKSYKPVAAYVND